MKPNSNLLHARLSDLVRGDDADDLRLAQAVAERVAMDVRWRDHVLGGHDYFDRCRQLHEATTGSGSDTTIPRVNLIRGMDEDTAAVAIANFPDATPEAERTLPPGMAQWERDIRLAILDETERSISAYVKSILARNHWPTLKERAAVEATVYGVSYFHVRVDRSNDLRRLPGLHRLLRQGKGPLSPEQAADLERMSRRICVEGLRAPQVLWEAGRTHWKECLRVSYIEWASTAGLRRAYPEHADRIAPGGPAVDGAPELHLDSTRDLDDALAPAVTTQRWGLHTDQTAVCTLYELEPVEKETDLQTGDYEGDSVPFRVTDWNLVCVKVAGSAVLEKGVVCSWPDEDDGEEEGSVLLPIVPVYVREALEHPYGFAGPIMMEVAESFINSMRAVIYRSAKKAASNQGVVIAVPNLGEGDLDEIEDVLEEGGVARIKGNANGPIDVRDVVMPLNYTAAPINPALMQAVAMEMEAFKGQSNTVGVDDLRSGRTGAAVRSKMAAADRPKTITVGLLSDAAEAVVERVIDHVRVCHRGQVSVVIDDPAGGLDPTRQGGVPVTLNEPFRHNVLTMDRAYASPGNPFGFRIETFEDVLNSVDVPFVVKAEGRSELPTDPVQRFQYLAGLVQLQAIAPATLRHLSLSDRLRNLDDRLRRQEEARQRQAQMEALALQRALGAPGQPGGAPGMPGVAAPGGAVPQAASMPAGGDNPFDPAGNLGGMALA